MSALSAHILGRPQADLDPPFVRLRERPDGIVGVPPARLRSPSGVQRPFHIPGHPVSAHFHDPNAQLEKLRAGLYGMGGFTVLHGLGGIGKSQLALKYVLTHGSAYAGVWWFAAETAAGLQLDARACCDAVPVAVRKGELPTLALKRWLAVQPDAWLLVFDNADSAALLGPHLPDSGLHHVLVTSRDPAWSAWTRPFGLDACTAEEGAAFLAARLPEARPSDLTALSKDLGGLPLALEQAASYIEATACGVSGYRGRLAAADALLDWDGVVTGCSRSVAATLSLAIDSLRPAAVQLLRLCAWAAPQRLPERFFIEARRHLPDALRAAAGNASAWDDTVGELRRYALADREDIADLDGSPEAPAGRTEQALRLHRLTQQAVRERLLATREDAAAFRAVLEKACPTDPKLPGHWPRFGLLAPHVARLDHLLAEGGIKMGALAGLFDRIGIYLQFSQAPYPLARSWLERALMLRNAALGNEHPDTLNAMDNLAWMLRAQGDPDSACELEQAMLAVRRRVLGDEHPAALTSMNNLALTLQAQGDPAGACEMHRAALAVRRRVLGDEHPDTLALMGNLAGASWAQGDADSARELQQAVLAVRSRLLGEEHPDALVSMANLAAVLWSSGERTKAIDHMRRAATGLACKLGVEHPNTRQVMDSLARMLAAPAPAAPDFASGLRSLLPRWFPRSR